jgi:exodeoxyribonuclease III
MKIISWNVNGIRAIIAKGLFDFMQKENVDVYCFQETKIHEQDIKEEHKDFSGYHSYWFSAQKKGYSGLVTYSRIKPLSVKKGIGIKEYDNEGRVLTLEFDDFYLVNTYFPNSQPELKRLDLKIDFNNKLLDFLQKLRKNKNVVVCGDFNVAHQEIDLKNPKANMKNPGFTIEERNWFTHLLEKGYVDVFRKIYPDEIKYSWWSYRFNARSKNIGWRIDYFVVNKEFFNKVKEIKIMNEVLGSDHCPVLLDVDVS